MTDELDQALAEFERQARPPFRPGGWYSKDGDLLFFHSRDVDVIHQSIDECVGVYRSMDDNGVAGVRILGLHHFTDDPLLAQDIQRSGEVDIERLLVAAYYRGPTGWRPAEERAALYREAIDVLRGKVEVPTTR